MNNKITKNDIKVLIFLLILFIIIAIITIMLSFNNSKEQKNTDNEFIDLSNMNIVDEYNTFFFVSNNVDKFLSIVEEQDSSKILETLDADYIKVNNITIDNVVDNFDNYGKDVYYRANYVYSKNFGTNYVYFTKGEIVATEYEEDIILNNNINLLLFVDYENLTISFRPVLDATEASEIIFNIKEISIANNGTNDFVANKVNVTTETICSLYLSDFILKLNYNIDKSYDILFDSMKEDFITVDEYEKYIKENINKFSYSIDRCGVNNTNSNKIYEVYDINGNFYKFSEKSVMNYIVYFELADEQGRG